MSSRPNGARCDSVSCVARVLRSRQQFVVDYEWTHARDNTDGPYSFPEAAGKHRMQNGPAAPARRHTVVTMMATLRAPGGDFS